MVHPISSSVETNPPTSPSPRGYPYKFDFRANHANITVLARVEGLSYAAVFQNRQVNCSIIEYPVFLMLLV